MNDEHNLRRAFFTLILIFLIGLIYIAYRGDRTADKLRENSITNCNSIKTNTTSMIKLHEDIVAGFAGRNQPVPPAIMADIAELHRLVPTCEGL